MVNGKKIVKNILHQKITAKNETIVNHEKTEEGIDFIFLLAL